MAQKNMDTKMLSNNNVTRIGELESKQNKDGF